MIDLTFLKKLDALSLIIRKNITSNYTGERKSKVTGAGLVFKDYSLYAPGSDTRHVDWRVYARTDKLFIKRFEEERNLTVHIVIDFSGSMGFGSAKITKSTYASMMAIGFAYIAMKNNERFVMSTFSDKLTSFRPRRGHRQLAMMYDLLNNKKAQGVTQFETAVSKYKKFIDTKSYVVVISDFLYDPEQIKNVLFKLRKHEVILVQVLDPLEKELPLEGDFKLRDLETQEILKTYISPITRKKYLATLQSHNNELNKFCEQTRARFFSFSTATPIFDAFYTVLSK